MQNTAPTKGNLMAAKRSRALAENGFELIDKKRNILIRELMALIDQALDIQGRINTVFSEAYEALRFANISMGGIEDFAEAINIDDSLSLRYRSVMGIEIPIVVSEIPKTTAMPYGFVGTTSALDNAFVKFSLAKLLMRDLAETENAIFRLAYSIKKTQKRANALQNLIIPGLDAAITGISDSLEEKEREEFVRLKVIKRKGE